MVVIQKDLEVKNNLIFKNVCSNCRKVKRKHTILLICFKCHLPIHYDLCGKWVLSETEDEIYYCCLNCN